MKSCLQRLSGDWLRVYGHEVLVAESFVDSQLFRGTCYKASGWTLLGQTQGYGRSRQDYYLAHERPKQHWVRELRPGARTMLRGRNLPAALQALEDGPVPECPQGPEELGRMRGFFGGLPDWRTRQGDYAVASLVTIVVCAALCRGASGAARPGGVCGRPDPGAMGRAGSAAPGQLAPLAGAQGDDVLPAAVEPGQPRVGTSPVGLAGPRAGAASGRGRPGGRDGKELLHSQGVAIVSASTVKGGRWLGAELVARKSNEIPAAQALLRRVPIEGMLVSADALHTQAETARIIVQERGADYLLTVKGNQPTVADNVRQLQAGLTRAFFPPA